MPGSDFPGSGGGGAEFGGDFSGSFSGSLTGTLTGSASYAETASFAVVAGSGTGSFTGTFSGAFEGSVEDAESASYAETSSFASTASYVDGAAISGAIVGGPGIAVDQPDPQTIRLSSNRAMFFTIWDSRPAHAILDNVPAAVTEQDSSRKEVDLSEFTEVRISVDVEGVGVDSEIAIQYSSDGGVGWEYMDNISQPTCSLKATGVITSEWIEMHDSAKSDILIKWVTQGGNSSESPVISSIILGAR